MIAEPFALAQQVGFSTTRLERIDGLMQAFIDGGVIAGGVTLLARKGRVAHLAAHGLRDIASGQSVRTDTLFRLASMTKPVISVGILMLLEEGRLLLTEPVSDYLPTFRNLKVAVPNPAAPNWATTELPAGEYHLQPAHREITIRDLLTHTSGLGSALTGPGFSEMAAMIQSIQVGESLSDVVPKMASVPLSFQPGSAWEYSPAFGFDVLGRIVEIVSGLELDEFLRSRLFGPLQMTDTTFNVPPQRLSELATPYDRGPNGLEEGTPTGILGFSTVPDNRYYSGGGGLVGTAKDYVRFALMLAQGGQFAPGDRLLGRKTVELMASNHIGDIPLVIGQMDLRGYRFGLGVRVLDDPGAASSPA